MKGLKGFFDWMEFPQGQARFSGMKRCWDEEGRETFALKVRGIEYFGEIEKSFLPDRHNFNLEIICFGYGRGEDVGIPGAAEVFTLEEAEICQQLITQLVDEGLKLDRPLGVLTQAENSRFMGDIAFRDGWISVAAEDYSS
jgi:hypothetical protein